MTRSASAPSSSADVTKPARSEVPSEQRRIELRGRGAMLNHQRDTLGAQPLAEHPTALVDRAEDRTRRDLGRLEPGLERFDRLQLCAAWYRDGVACAFLVGLRSADMDKEAFGLPLYVGDVEGHKLGAPQRGAESDQQQCAITLAQDGVGQRLQHRP